jgi:signal transduction histidine kinase
MPVNGAVPIMRRMELPFSVLGRHRPLGVGLALLVEAAILAAVVQLDPSTMVGIPAAIVAAIAGSVAVAFGPWDGAIVAFSGAVAFGLLVGWTGDAPAALVVWPAIVIPVGFFGRRVAEQRMALGQLVVSQELERQRLAVELHDEAAQSLAAALLALRRLDGAATAAGADASRAELRELIQRTLERVRGLAVDLRPRSLDDFGLPAAAETLAATFTARTGLPVDVAFDHCQRLPTRIELPLFRVLQDALQSVTEHVDATRVRVTLTTTPAGTVFEVADDGNTRGSGLAETQRLASARERLRLVGGRLTVLTPSGAGTIVRATVPAGTT